MGNGSQDGGLTFYLSERFYDEHKEVLNHLILQFGSVQLPGLSEADVIDFLGKRPVGGWVYTTNTPLVSYLRLNGLAPHKLQKGE